MRIGAYQFSVSGNAEDNFIRMKAGIRKAAEAGVRLLVFPECAVTGYPPRCIGSPADVDDEAVDRIHGQLQKIAEERQIFLVTGTIIREGSQYYNSALVFRPDGKRESYGKRALWGWDRDHFSEGQEPGVVEIDSLKVGVRICYEVRFPEYFRELRRQQTDLNLILFFDVTDEDDPDRFGLIRGHIRTRAAENVCPILACSACTPFQAAPTGLYDRSGKVLAEAARGKEELLVYDLEKEPLSFSEQGRKEISDLLVAPAKARIRPVCEADAPFLNSLMNRPSVLDALNEVPTELQDWSDAIGEWLRDDDEEDYIVLIGTAPVGWLGVNGLLNEDQSAYLKMAAFLPEYQGRGFGTAAIRELMQNLKARGTKKMILYTDRDNLLAQGCYRKCGFGIVESLTETMSNGKNVPRYRMESCLCSK